MASPGRRAKVQVTGHQPVTSSEVRVTGGRTRSSAIHVNFIVFVIIHTKIHINKEKSVLFIFSIFSVSRS